jgi:hypothetical protein
MATKQKGDCGDKTYEGNDQTASNDNHSGDRRSEIY